ncbi:hypothetical protein Bca52824_059482 [Brassica carinata]|uniref:Uncharacterized protein n=1 Tax=Brassica carinata TaxID=52824 RepID=A0A8X7QVZ2_BRACI|nr:hypothetical protein Bca52824_059482 [Brassica carinata]
MSVKMRTTCTWTERPYEASLLGGRQRRPPSGARASQKVTEAQRFPRPGRRLSLECKGRRELDCKTRAGTKVGLSDPTVLSGRAVAQRIKVTLGITS